MSNSDWEYSVAIYAFRDKIAAFRKENNKKINISKETLDGYLETLNKKADNEKKGFKHIVQGDSSILSLYIKRNRDDPKYPKKREQELDEKVAGLIHYNEDFAELIKKCTLFVFLCTLFIRK